MTYDDGVIGIYTIAQDVEPGSMPRDGIALDERFCFSYENIGISRYYTAMQAGQQIEAVVNIPGWHPVRANVSIAIIADADGVIDSETPQFRVVMVQPTADEYGLRMTKLSLERVGEQYAILT